MAQEQQGRKSRIQGQLTYVLATVIVLVVFGVLAWMVLEEILTGESLIFFAGFIVGYLARAAAGR